MNPPFASSLVINQQPISLQQILQRFRKAGKLDAVLAEVLSHYVLEQELDQSEFDIEDNIVEETIAQYREQHNLTADANFREWLLDNGLDSIAFAEHIRFTLKVDALKTKLSEPRLLETFMEQKLELDQAVVSHIAVDDRELAEELKLQIEEGAEFTTFVREYSRSDDAMTNGVMGVLSRADIQAMFGIDIYQAAVGQIVGPILCGENWHLLRLDNLLPATLDESTIPLLQERVLEQWLASKVQSLQVELYLTDPCLSEGHWSAA